MALDPLITLEQVIEDTLTLHTASTDRKPAHPEYEKAVARMRENLELIRLDIGDQTDRRVVEPA